MTDFDEFKRMNYFKGFFTTADDWKAEQRYHREKLRLHNRGLHTPGVLKGVAMDLRVRAGGGLNLEILPGAALDGNGNELLVAQPRTFLVPALAAGSPRVVYVSLRYLEAEDERVLNTAVPEYSGNKRIKEVPDIVVSETRPDNLEAIELARIDLQPGAAAIAEPADPQSPKANEIDRRHVPFAGSVCLPDEGRWISRELQERLVQLMGRTRRDFASLGGRFPTASSADVRHGALTLQMLARIGFMEERHLAGLLYSLAETEKDTGQEIGAAYGVLAAMEGFRAYTAAVDRLLAEIGTGTVDLMLTRQDQVAEAARELAEIVLRLPEAEAGAAQVVTTPGEEGVASLDGSGSRAFDGRTVSRFRWSLVSSAALPVAHAGSNLIVGTAGGEAVVTLDGSKSQGLGGERLVRYRWDKR